MKKLLILPVLSLAFIGCGNSKDTSNSNISNATNVVEEPEVKYEQVLYFEASEERVLFVVNSGGCTTKASFDVTVIDDKKLALVRKSDAIICEGLPRPIELIYTWDELKTDFGVKESTKTYILRAVQTPAPIIVEPEAPAEECESYDSQFNNLTQYDFESLQSLSTSTLETMLEEIKELKASLINDGCYVGETRTKLSNLRANILDIVDP